MRMPQVEEKALSILEETDASRLPVDVELVAHRLGLSTDASELPSEISGLLTLRGKKGVILYNEAHPKVRQRFTIAHEIGHYCLHRNSGDLFIDKHYPVWLRDSKASTGEDRQEIEANGFAAALLMPRPILVAEYEKLDQAFDLDDENSLADLASTFGVSTQAMTIRLTNVFTL